MASYDVIFIGGGPAGYVGAIRCAQLGMSVAVVEREGLGGTCVLWGCIPAKALLESASLATKVSHAKDFGITVGDVKLDYGVAMKRSRAVSTQNSKGVEFLFKKNKITWIKGTGRIAGKNAVAVKVEGKEEKHEAKKAIVICTGSRVKGLPQIGLELNKSTVISSDEARAGADDNRLLRFVFLFLAFDFHCDRVLPCDSAGALDPRDFVFLEQELYALGVLGADRAGALHRHAIVELYVADGDAEILGVRDFSGKRSGFEKGLGGDAAPEHAGAAESFPLYDPHSHSELRTTDGAHVSGGSTTNENHIERGHLLVAGWSSRAADQRINLVARPD